MMLPSEIYFWEYVQLHYKLRQSCSSTVRGDLVPLPTSLDQMLQELSHPSSPILLLHLPPRI